jgi:hypothetical protein
MHPEVTNPDWVNARYAVWTLCQLSKRKKIRPVMSISIMKLWQRIHIGGVKNSDPKNVVGMIKSCKS